MTTEDTTTTTTTTAVTKECDRCGSTYTYYPNGLIPGPWPHADKWCRTCTVIEHDEARARQRAALEGPAIELTPSLTAVAPTAKPGTLAFVAHDILLFATDSPDDTADLLMALTQLAQATAPQPTPPPQQTVDERIAQGRQQHARQVARPGEQVHQSGLIVPPGSAP